MSAELASHDGGLAAEQGPHGFAPPLSPPSAGQTTSSMTTNMHGYLGLVPGVPEQSHVANPGAAPEFPAAAPAPAAAPEPAPSTSALEALLLRFGLVSSDQLGEALREQAETGRPVGAIVVERGWVSADDVERLTGTAVAAPVQAPPAPLPAPAPAPAPDPEPASFPEVPAFDDLPEPPSPVFHVVEPVAVVEPVTPAPEPEHAPEPGPELPTIAPIVPFQGTFTPMDETEDEQPEPQPAAVALPEPAPVVPLEAPAPTVAPITPVIQAAPALTPILTPYTAEPEPTPPAVPLGAAPMPRPTPVSGLDQPRVKHLVIARLTTGERVEVNSYADRNAARAEAKALMAYLREGHPDWPFVNGRFIRPESIVSIDLETVLLT